MPQKQSNIELTLNSSNSSRAPHSNIYEDPSTRAIPGIVTSDQAIEKSHGERTSKPTKSTMEGPIGTLNLLQNFNNSSTHLI
jgi:hypothetical protein